MGVTRKNPKDYWARKFPSQATPFFASVIPFRKFAIPHELLGNKSHYGFGCVIDILTGMIVDYAVLYHLYIYDEENSEDVCKTMISKMFATMSDRSSVNKKFTEELGKHKRDISESDSTGNSSDLICLYCNAHFLLGLSHKSLTMLSHTVMAVQQWATAWTRQVPNIT